jgi:hypothetical protein
MSKGARPSDAARDLLVREGILAKVPRAFRDAPVAETTAAPAATVTARETPGSPEEVDAVDAENVHLAADAPGAPAEAEPEPAAAPAVEPADDGGAAGAAAES